MSYIELVKELRKTMLNIKKETKNLENTINGTSKLEDLDDVEIDFEELKNQILILDEELEGFEETVNDEEFQALKIYQEPISCDTYGLGPWQ
ncbi:Uncharacterised protein [[Clostridium] sordellii]|uniref:Uncharacterized protein n=1 Tax=Paraclostridium sordellii TaxID=1505 RepID=A0A0C7R7T6_PARSO|nr:hypothetical protein [Paeniclostridium sordellii]CEQ04114.1 Uncharacterised protein [[Clostridium] sordellii] [Paeniclostridium sordellii]